MLHLIRRWHRTIGISCVIFIILLTISGILLNYTEQIGLNTIHITNKRLLDWYNIRAKSSKSFAIQSNWITQIGSQLYFNKTKIADHITENLIGAVSTQDGIMIALGTTFLLLTDNGEIIEKITDLDCLPAPIKTIGTTSKGTIVRTTQGDYLIDLDMQHCERADYLAIDIVHSLPPPKNLHTELSQLYRSHGLSLEKLIIDIHSGRILGQAGILLVNLMALLFLILSMSGIYLWFKHTMISNTKHKQQKRKKNNG